MSKCPWHAGRIVAPCSLYSCDFYAPGHPLHCGFAAYQQISKTLKSNEEVSWAVLASWLDMDKKAIEDQAQKAYTELKRAGTEHFFLGDVIPVQQEGVCIVCGRPAKIKENDFSYCSAECKAYLPAEALLAEMAWEHPLSELLGYLKEYDYRTVTRYLKVSRDTYASLLWQHLGICQAGAEETRKKKFMPSPRTPNRAQLLRRLQASRLWAQSL